MSLYLRETINSYLSDRYIAYNIEDGAAVNTRMCREVTQGSVNAPLLWNVGFNHVLEAAVPVGVQLVCYADDTLLIASGKSLDPHTEDDGGDCGRHHYQNLGLKVAVAKTKALWLHGRWISFPDQGNLLLRNGLTGNIRGMHQSQRGAQVSRPHLRWSPELTSIA